MKIKLFSERSYLAKGFLQDVILYPFWGEPLENPDSPQDASWSRAFDNYTLTGHSFFEMSSLEDADLVVLPSNCESIFDPEAQALATQLAINAKRVGKPLVGFFYGDRSHLELPIQCDLVFRNSLYRSTRKPSDFAYPAWSVDFTKKYFQGEVPIRYKRSKPTVGFCGFIGKNNPKLYAKRLIYAVRRSFGREATPPHFSGQIIRRNALSVLMKSPLINANFVFRDQMGLFSEADLAMREKIRQTFVKNMAESDYVFCCRGYGNYSFRFYETLSSGRIPVFINTDCVLPYDFDIDWKKYCVWLDEKDIPFIAEKIAEFHDKLSDQEFIDLQYECRKIWEERLSPEGFFANLHRHLSLSTAKS